MSKRRVATRTSRTAALTCASRAASAMESRPHYRSNDYIAVLLIPTPLKWLLRLSLGRKLFSQVMAPAGIYEYVIARTKYIDAAFEEALRAGFDQVLIFGAGFDSRSLRFADAAHGTTIFELDMPVTQQAKLEQYARRGVEVPSNVEFVAIDFDHESLEGKLSEAGFRRGQRTLFILEGLLMYLQPESVASTMQSISNLAGVGSWVVFDYVHASVLRGEGLHYGERAVRGLVEQAEEGWRFGIEKNQVTPFLAEYGMRPLDHKDAAALGAAYFTDDRGRMVGRVNGTHCLVTAEVLQPGEQLAL